MIRAVLDVNVLASAIGTPAGNSAVVVNAAISGTFRAVLSETMLDRLAETLNKPYFRAKRSEESRRAAMAEIRRYAELVVTAADIRGLLERDGYRGPTLLTPASFRLVLESPAAAESR